MSNHEFFMHVGLPRTATTILQREVFPNLEDVIYLGKPWDNKPTINNFDPLKLISEINLDYKNNNHLSPHLISILPGILKEIKIKNQYDKHKDSNLFVDLMRQSLNLLQDVFLSKSLLYSDESLIESVAGLSSNIKHGFHVPLEQLAAAGALDKVTVIIVLRDPFDFLRASWYKNNEFQHKFGMKPISFDEWIRQQMALYMHKPSASRIFLAMQKSFSEHVKSYCPKVIISHYEDLLTTDDIMMKLTDGVISTPKINLKSFPKENESFRHHHVVNFMLSARGVPENISLSEYTATFEDTYHHYGIYDLLNAERIER